MLKMLSVAELVVYVRKLNFHREFRKFTIFILLTWLYLGTEMEWSYNKQMSKRCGAIRGKGILLFLMLMLTVHSDIPLFFSLL